ncbi:hypothetical protein C1646_661215, partial [Rhizophagus diaphanus]
VKRKELIPSDRKLVHCKAEGFGKESENDEFYIKIYDSVHLENGQILRTTGEFQGKEWFANVAVIPAEDQNQYSSDKGAWYRKFCSVFRKVANNVSLNFEMQ